MKIKKNKTYKKTKQNKNKKRHNVLFIYTILQHHTTTTMGFNQTRRKL
jgi:hypothetical protein